MRVIPTDLPGLIIVEPVVHRDPRGYFLETFHSRKYGEHGIPATFLQDNHSSSVHNTLRGLHLQVHKPQGKLVRVIEGEIWDVAVDVRRGSPTFGRWAGVHLSADNFRQVYVPPGFAHGFYVTSPSAQVEYKCTELYDPSDELGIAYNDATLAINWPSSSPLLSDRDRKFPPLAELTHRLPVFEALKDDGGGAATVHMPAGADRDAT
jgi:dTDP-4-dehydrorhamnose 3,5-epimerase